MQPMCNTILLRCVTDHFMHTREVTLIENLDCRTDYLTMYIIEPTLISKTTKRLESQIWSIS